MSLQNRQLVSIMKYLIAVLLCLLAVALASELQIETTHKPEACTRVTKSGDQIAVHYEGKLESGKIFDSSFTRGQPIDFAVGTGRVIQGWDQGLLGMCVGEKRTLTIPPQLGYGARGAGNVIPPNAVLIFRTELVSINGAKDEL